jgi:CAAX protease family protein
VIEAKPPLSRLPKPGPGVLEPVPWGVLSVFVLVCLAAGLFASVLLTAVVIAKFAGLHGHTAQLGATELTATIVFDLCIFGLALLFALSRKGVDLQMYGFRGFPLADLVLPAVGILAIYLILALYVGAVTALHLPRLKPVPNVPEDLLHARNLIVPTMLAACVIAPIVEETFFRGFVFRGLLKINFWTAALASGLLFAVFHGEIGLLIPFTCVGALFAWMFWRTGSLWPNIIAHAGFNTVSLILALYVQR